jgi:hypothetical protein
MIFSKVPVCFYNDCTLVVGPDVDYFDGLDLVIPWSRIDLPLKIPVATRYLLTSTKHDVPK